MSRDYRLRVSSPYFLYLYVQKYKSVASVGLSVAVGPCALHALHTLLLRHWQSASNWKVTPFTRALVSFDAWQLIHQ